MITLSVTVKTMRNVCAIFTKIHYIGITMNYTLRNRSMGFPIYPRCK